MVRLRRSTIRGWLALTAVLLSAVLSASIAASACVEPDDQRPVAQAPYEITIDSSRVRELEEWSKSLRPIVDTWYPILVAALPSDGYTAPAKVRIEIRDEDGIAYASGTRIVLTKKWFTWHPDDRGAVVHELVHVVQQYRGRNPGWLVEGIADYLRWFQYEPVSRQPRPDPKRAKYTDSYQTTGAFLNYLTNHVDPELVVKLNAAMREGRYRPELWKERIGNTVDELWARYLRTLGQ